MKRQIKTMLSLCLVLALLLSAAVLPVGAKGGKITDTPDLALSGAFYDVVAEDSVITPEHGSLENGRARGGAVMHIALDPAAHPDATFLCWKSAYGDVVDETSFEVYVDRDVYFYPVYSDLMPAFGEWELLRLRNCELGDIYVRTDPALGCRQYKVKYFNWGSHDEPEYECVDADTCRRVCRRCGWYEDLEHDLTCTIITEPAVGQPGLAEYVCVNGCGYSFTEQIDPLSEQEHEHQWIDSYDDIVIEARDGQPGVRRLHCSLCSATEEVWYIRAEWEKYYFGNHVFFDTSDSSGLWGTADEHHYSFVNDDGSNAYLYAVREDYRDDDTCWEFLWIDRADALGRKPLYVAKSKGQGETYIYNPYSWAVIDCDIHTVDQYIDFIDHIRSGYDRYSSSFFDDVKRYETLYNQQMFPADGPSDFLSNMNGAWVYETDDTLRVDDATGIEYYDIMFSDRREFLHIDPLTNCVLRRYEPNASYRWAQIKQIKPIVTPAEYDGISADFPWVQPTPAPQAADGEDIPGHGDQHSYSNYYQQTQVNEQYHKCVCEICGKELYSPHELTVRTPHLRFDAPTASTATYYCPLCGYEEEQPYLMTTDEIRQNLYRYFSEKSTRGISLNNNVLKTPNPVNFQLRVDNAYLVGGPSDNTYAEGHGGFNRYACTGYAASNAFTYSGAQSDIFAFGVIRTSDSEYAAVDLKLPDVANYVFRRWEVYDWATGSWQLFSTDPTPRFNCITDGADSRVHDLTILRAVREYVEPARYAVTVVGGCFYATTESREDRRASGEVDAAAQIYIECDEDMIPAGKNIDHYDVYNAAGELIDTTDGWSYTVTEDGLVFRAAYVDRLYWTGFDAENGAVVLFSDSAGEAPEEGAIPEEYWGGEYPAGTVISVTTMSADEEVYPYFLGWYYVSYDELEGETRELLSVDPQLTVTVRAADDKEGYGSYRAVWSETETPAEVIEYRTLHVSDGFASVRRNREGLYLSCVRVPYHSGVSFLADPGAFTDVEVWSLSGVFEDESAFSAECFPDDGEYWFEGEECAPAHVYAAFSGQSNLVFADGDGDGEITINDVTRIQRALAGYSDDLYGRVGITCDVTGSGGVDILDATLLQRFLAGFTVENQALIGAPMPTEA